MSETMFEDPLEIKVDELKAKAKRAEQANDVENEIQRAQENIRQLALELASLNSIVKSLLFYDGILTKVFNANRLEGVDRAIERARDDSKISDEEVLDAAKNRRTRNLTRGIEDAQEVVRHARRETIEEIRSHQRKWEGEIESARDLNQIIGGAGSDFETVLNDMDSFLTNTIWSEDRSITSLEARWDSLTNKWSQNAGKHGWEAFQREHGLSDPSMDILKQFAEKGSVRLNEVSSTVLQEMKEVEELESAIRMEIDTR